MDSEYLLNISIIDAIGWSTILKYLFLLAVEIAACVYLTSRNEKKRQQALRWRAFGLMLGLSVLGNFVQGFDSYCIWFMVIVTTTAILANTRLGFAEDEVEPTRTLTIATPFRNLVFWLALVILSHSLGVGANVLGTIYHGPRIEHREVWYVHHEQGGSLSLNFKEDDWGFRVHVTNDYTSYFEEGDCLELTYYAPYDPFDYLESFATKIRRSDKCK